MTASSGGRGEAVINSKANQRSFRREHLPNPRAYYAWALGIPAGRSGWVSTKCPFHEDGCPSLSINLEHGGFRCHACGAKGSDVVAFHMKRHGLDFKAAAKELGA
jgi:hypothetical protein